MSITEIDDTEAKVVDWEINFELDNGKVLPFWEVFTESEACRIDDIICDLVRKNGIWHGDR